MRGWRVAGFKFLQHPRVRNSLVGEGGGAERRLDYPQRVLLLPAHAFFRLYVTQLRGDMCVALRLGLADLVLL